MHRDHKAYLQDIVDCGNKIAEVITAVSLEEYLASWQTQDIVERELITIGEALAQLRELESPYLENISCVNEIIAVRNRLIHGYITIESERIYTSALNDVPILVSEAVKAL